MVKYLRDGAIPVFSHLDILYEYYTSGSARIYDDDTISWPEICGEEDIVKRDSRSENKKKTAAKASAKKKDENKEKEDSNDNLQSGMLYERFFDDMTNDQQVVVFCLKDGEMYPDEIAEKSKLDPMSILGT